MLACSLEWPKGSICQATRGKPHSPNVRLRNLREHIFYCFYGNGDDFLKKKTVEPQSESHLFDDGRVVSGRLIVHGPPSPDELELSIVDELPNIRLYLRVLVLPPTGEKRSLDVDEATRWVLLQLVDNAVQRVLHARQLDPVPVCGFYNMG
jgi:hypothetical protein